MTTFINTIIAIAVIFGFVAFLCGITILSVKISNWSYDRTVAKRREAHPALYELFDAIERKGTEYCTLHNAEIAPRKNQIDVILRDWDYYPVAVREQKERELEELRQSIEATKATLEILADEKTALREQIHDYVEQHNLEWAKRMGW